MPTETTIKDGKIAFRNTDLPDVIELKGVSQTYDNGKSFVIKDFNLLIEDHPNIGQFVVILGPSGCGKSTILRYIAGLSKPTSGEVLINGKPLYGSVPMVFQSYSSLPWRTVLENVLLPLELKGTIKKEDRDRALLMIEKAGLAEHVNKYAQDTVLSGGQLQRVAIARSLISNPEIILMDEPFGALDIYTRFKMQLILTGIWQELKSTIIFVTHDPSEAVFLGEDIYIMSSQPARMVKHIDIDLPYPRTREIKHDPQFNKYVREIEDTIFDLNSHKS